MSGCGQSPPFSPRDGGGMKRRQEGKKVGLLRARKADLDRTASGCSPRNARRPRSPARRESPPDGQTASQTALSRDTPKIRRATLKRFCPQGKQRRPRTPAGRQGRQPVPSARGRRAQAPRAGGLGALFRSEWGSSANRRRQVHAQGLAACGVFGKRGDGALGGADATLGNVGNAEFAGVHFAVWKLRSLGLGKSES